VVGSTNSSEATFPVTGGPDLVYNGAGDAFIAKVDPSPTAVELVSFEATPAPGAIELVWKSGSELQNLGFHLYRASEAARPYERITSSLIPGLGSSPTGATYRYRDSGLESGANYSTCWRTWRRPGGRSVTDQSPPAPRPVAQPPASQDGGDGAVRIVYGDPTATSFRILERGAAHLSLELTTPGFYAFPPPDGSARLEVPGFEEVSEPGAPAIPVKRAWIEVMAGRKVKLASVRASDVVAFTGLRPLPASSPVIVATEDGTVRAGRRAAPASFASQGLPPDEAARILGSGFQGEVKKAQVELAPLRWDASSGRVLLARKLTVRFVFAGRELEERSSGGSRGRRHREPRSHRSGSALVRLATRASGLYAGRFEEIFGARPRALSASQLSLTRQGQPVAFHIEPEGDRFGPGSLLYFVSGGAALNPYGNEAVYELRHEQGGARMSIGAASPWARTSPPSGSLELGSKTAITRRDCWRHPTSGCGTCWSRPW
jgi:hypothetical protein